MAPRTEEIMTRKAKILTLKLMKIKRIYPQGLKLSELSPRHWVKLGGGAWRVKFGGEIFTDRKIQPSRTFNPVASNQGARPEGNCNCGLIENTCRHELDPMSQCGDVSLLPREEFCFAS
jgi:hypothetical protein